MDKRIFKCYECNYVWDVEFGAHRPSECPKCGSNNIYQEDKHRLRGRERNRHFGWKHSGETQR